MMTITHNIHYRHQVHPQPVLSIAPLRGAIKVLYLGINIASWSAQSSFQLYEFLTSAVFDLFTRTNKMSRAKGLLPITLATVIGVGTGIAIFDPAFKQEKEQKEQEQKMDFKEQHPTHPQSRSV
ncbi:hypothetical protein N7G274_000948 [Stereocaulon virgatum]|uniref:Uncharacterized protein n=1 Tax=Stereocaulon virgatum TaxID=373712 RepID=A0ABR4AN98_9LECA